MLRENWAVWFAYDLEGSYEEAPQAMIENAQRERRWCQGNLQHGLVLFAKGLRGVSRMHLTLGICGYLAGPLWLAFLITVNWIRWFQKYTGLSEISVPAFNPYLANWSSTAHALLVFVICMVVIMLPKFLALVDLAHDAPRRRAFGGLARATAGVVGETIFSTLHAPLLMLWHTRFVLTNLFGISVGWSPQKRAADGTTWLYAAATALGPRRSSAWRGVCSCGIWNQRFSGGSRPCSPEWCLSVPLSVLTSRRSLGARARVARLFLTPEETQPPTELISLRAQMKIHELTDRHHAAPGARRFGRGRARSLRQRHPRLAPARKAAQPDLRRAIRQARRRHRKSQRAR